MTQPSLHRRILKWTVRLFLVTMATAVVTVLSFTIHKYELGSQQSRIAELLYTVAYILVGLSLTVVMPILIFASAAAWWLDRVRRASAFMAPARPIRTWRIVIRVLLANLIATAVIDTGIVLALARAISSSTLWIVLGLGGMTLRSGGYLGPPGSTDFLATTFLLPNLIVQYLIVRFTVGQLAWRLRRNRRFVAIL